MAPLQNSFSLSSDPVPPRLVGLGGFEPPTPRLSSVCSNQLSYRPPHLPGIPLGFFSNFISRVIYVRAYFIVCFYLFRE